MNFEAKLKEGTDWVPQTEKATLARLDESNAQGI